MEKKGFTEEKVENLDLKEKKILYELDFNARLSYAQLGRKVGLSKQGAEYKMNSLVKKRVIKGFYPVINVPKLGFLYCRLLITVQNVTKEKREEFLSYLKNHKSVFWLLEMQGQYDILIVIWARTITEFKMFGEEIEKKYGEYIKKKIETVATDVIHLQHRYLLGKTETKEIHIRETGERGVIDALDKKILSTLCADARMSLMRIAKECKTSAKVVAYRMRKMERMKIIEGYRPIINHNALGYTYYKLFITINKGTKEALRKVKSYIKQIPLCVYIVEGVGLTADLDVEIMVQSNQELFSFIEQLRFTFPTSIGEYQTVIFL
ncbi:MAG: winged helix-turn-helix transcriptional regulator, partial [Nanoarchaeota archaeon]